jgi:hypothetical protein
MVGAVPPILAAAPKMIDVALWSGIAGGLIAVLAVLVYAARRYRMRAWTRKEPPGGGLTIEKAEEMYRSGQISRPEFSTLRRSLLGLGPASGARSGLSAPAQADDVTKATEEPPPPIEKEQE